MTHLTYEERMKRDFDLRQVILHGTDAEVLAAARELRAIDAEERAQRDRRTAALRREAALLGDYTCEFCGVEARIPHEHTHKLCPRCEREHYN